MENYMLKAIREAKKNTSWLNRNTEYEGAVSSFLRELLKPGRQNRFLNDFLAFQHRVARIGLWNSLSQTLLKLTSPGVPDIYQGTELWDFSLVDPDNRRPVDYSTRQKRFESTRELGDVSRAIARLLETPEDGRLKLFLTWKTLCVRKQQADVFQQGEYLQLEVQGAKANHAVAFMRKCEKASVLVVVPRLVAGLLNDVDIAPIGSRVWDDTRIMLPGYGVRNKCRNVFTGKLLDSVTQISLAETLAEFPVALCLLS
jgi:(1->4)-alpha-D-glucan 1-alpha-D-glucosylmutase